MTGSLSLICFVRFVWRQLGVAFFGALTLVGALFIFEGITDMIVTFCGHSQYIAKQEDEEKILSLLQNEVGNAPAEFFLGGYGAFDTFAFHCCKKYQATHPSVKLVFVSPYLNAEKNGYDAVLYPTLEQVPLKFALSHRNRWMVENADVVVAYIDHAWGGAYQTCVHAKRRQKTIFYLNTRKGQAQTF